MKFYETTYIIHSALQAGRLDDLTKSPMINSPSSYEKTPIKGRLNKSEYFRGTPTKQKPVTDRTSDMDFNITPLLTNIRNTP